MKKIFKPKILKAIIAFIIIELLLLFFFVGAIQESRQIEAEDTEQIVVTVDSTERIHALRFDRFYIYANGVRYKFSNIGAFAKSYSNSELDREIKTGDVLTLTYYEKHTLFNGGLWVADARSENTVYRDFDEYNAAKNGVDVILTIIFVTFELVFAVAVVLYVRWHKKEFKLLFRRK
jgi:hypothetical protein